MHSHTVPTLEAPPTDQLARAASPPTAGSNPCFRVEAKMNQPLQALPSYGRYTPRAETAPSLCSGGRKNSVSSSETNMKNGAPKDMISALKMIDLDWFGRRREQLHPESKTPCSSRTVSALLQACEKSTVAPPACILLVAVRQVQSTFTVFWILLVQKSAYQTFNPIHPSWEFQPSTIANCGGPNCLGNHTCKSSGLR